MTLSTGRKVIVTSRLPRIGAFGRSTANDFGVGRILEATRVSSTLEYFESPVDESVRRVVVETASVEEVELEAETRVYFQDSATLAWMIGRVMDCQSSDHRYLVKFPNRDTRLLPESVLKVRSNRPIKDPTDHLAAQLNETPFWHEGRVEFVEAIFKQREFSGGIPSLLSSAIDLVRHQAEVVQRVLHDPFQRYLLADEVGLGKTIEAGILIRQFVLDEPKHHPVLVIVPEVLISQWQQELRHRFHLDDELGDAIQIVGHRDAEGIARAGGCARMVVVDEAHHVAALAWADNTQERRVYEELARIADEPTRRLLLLSATPVLHNEHAFLAMLHLLDPAVYSLDDIESFRERVRHRQGVAEGMLSLTESESNYFLGNAIDDLGQFFPADQHFRDLADKTRELLGRDVAEDDPERCRLVSQLRSHVSETWRLHRRLLRNRRSRDLECYLPGRGGYETATWDSSSVSGVNDLLRSLRSQFSDRLYTETDLERRSSVVNLLRTLEEAAACDLNTLANLVAVRLAEEVPSLDLTSGEIASVKSPVSFDGEEALLRQIVDTCKGQRQTARMRTVLDQVTAERVRGDSSIVVFTNYPTTADRLHAFLAGKLSRDVVFRHRLEASDWTRFHDANRGLVLICDRTAEEGLNLQNRRSVVIHYDLPFSPNRIEQRLGRLDRFGSGHKVRSIVIVPEQESTESVWARLMGQGFQVFSRSIASLQYVIEEEMRSTWKEFLDSGADAIDSLCSRLQGEKGLIETELRRIHAQDEIDSFEHQPMGEQGFENLERMDLEAANTMKRVLHHWLGTRLNFCVSGEEGQLDDVVRYQFTRRDDRSTRGNNTLMPYGDFERYFGDSLDYESETPKWVLAETFPLAFDRQTAQKRIARLARVGDSFVDALSRYLEWDDRGICFAMWRYRPEFQTHTYAQLGFRISFVVESDLTPIKSLCKAWPEASLEALRRRADSVFRPFATSIWLNAELKPISSNERKVFAERYRKEWVHGSGRDFNLNNQRWMEVAKAVDISSWPALCKAARASAEVVLREKSQLMAMAEQKAQLAASQCEARIHLYQSRLSHSSGNLSEGITRDLEFESAFNTSLVEAIRKPSLRVDSIGAVFLSPNNPFSELRQNELDV
jgi:ATP-dependent helicase HepA